MRRRLTAGKGSKMEGKAKTKKTKEKRKPEQ